MLCIGIINEELVLNEEIEPYLLEYEQENEKNDKTINNRHDKCFRDILNDKNEIISLLRNFVNSGNTIKSEEIEHYNTNFITSKYQNKEADVVYKIKGKNAFILIEHQSKIDSKMPYRLLEYYIEILRSSNKNSNSMPIVIPIIIYTGNEKWKTNGYISEKQEVVEGYKEGRLDIKYNLVQANKFKIEELLSKGSMLAIAMIIENSNDTEELIRNLEKIIEEIKDKEKLYKLRNIVKYILKGILNREEIKKIEKMIDKKEEEDNMDELIEKIKRNDKKKMEEIAQNAMKDGIREGMSKGMSKGISQGIAKGMEKAVINMTKKLKKLNLPLEQIIQVTGLTEEKIKSIK